jgi:hypothetical protein
VHQLDALPSLSIVIDRSGWSSQRAFSPAYGDMRWSEYGGDETHTSEGLWRRSGGRLRLAWVMGDTVPAVPEALAEGSCDA